jgi:prevent-host-death family protein
MPIIDINTAENQLLSLLEAAQRGEEVVISRDGQVVAQIVAVLPRKQLREPGSMAGKILIADDFDAPLPEEMQALFEGQ